MSNGLLSRNPDLPIWRRRFYPLLLVVLICVSTSLAHGAESASGMAVELYVAPGCPHCAAAKNFLSQLLIEQPALQLRIVDIKSDPAALARLNELSSQAGIAQAGIPSIVIGERLIVGFDSPATTGAQIRALLSGIPASMETGNSGQCAITDETGCTTPPNEAIRIPWLDKTISVNEIGLPVFTLLIGLIDGLNPCSMWVLILMLSILSTQADRRRMLTIAGTFVAIEGIAYFAFMAAWLNLFLLIGLSRHSEIVIALVAIGAGSLNLKDFFAFGRGLTLSIPSSAKPGIYTRLRSILRTEKLGPALAGAALLAVLVQLVELLCTSGFPAIYTRILTMRQLDRASYYAYLLLYNLMYMLDDIVVLGIGVITLSRHRLQENEERLLKFLSGLVMLGLGLYLLFPGMPGR